MTASGSTPTPTASRTRARPASTASPSSSSTPPTTSSPPPPPAATATTPSTTWRPAPTPCKVVASSLPAGVAETYDLDGIASANQATFTLAAGQHRTDVDFGYRNTGSVGDRVWLDTNGNGVQDAGEAGINGVTVQLLDGANNVVATATTSGDGNYTFDNLAAGTYTVKVVASSLPAGVAETYDLDGVASANQATFTLAAGQNRTDVDFGYRNTGSVGDRVWLDANANGIQDAGEPGINGVTVQLLDAANNVDRHHDHQRQRQLHLQQPGRRHLHREDRRLLAPRRSRGDLRPRRRRLGQPGHLHPQRRRQTAPTSTSATGPPARSATAIWNDGNGNGVQDAGEAGHQRRHRPAARRRQQRHRHHDHQRRRQLHLQQPAPAAPTPSASSPPPSPRGWRRPTTSTASPPPTRPPSPSPPGQTRTDVDFGYRIPPGNQQYCAIESLLGSGLQQRPERPCLLAARHRHGLRLHAVARQLHRQQRRHRDPDRDPAQQVESRQRVHRHGELQRLHHDGRPPAARRRSCSPRRTSRTAVRSIRPPGSTTPPSPAPSPAPATTRER